MIPDALRPALYVQLSYATLVVAWQGIGLALLSSGRPALGPTASMSVAVQASIMAVLLVFSARRLPLVFVLLSVVSGLAALSAIANAFTADPSLWHSDLRRYAGVALNSMGLIGFAMAVLGYLRWRGASSPQSK
jgi:hypothetical protein